MAFDPTYHEDEPTREEIDQSAGALVLEFGANWCGHCQQLSPTLESMFQKHPNVRHVRIADGKGKRLGRSFRVKLWPTLVFIQDGQVLDQRARPTAEEARQGFAQLQAGD
ncbi:MAG: thioredoxin family protein [Planctomycetaceae bacterium]